MLIQNIDNKKLISTDDIKTNVEESHYFIICNPHELLDLKHIFHFDEITIVDCLNFDDRIRFTNFNNYDFISIVYFWLENEKVNLHEINLYISNRFIVFVVPEISLCSNFDKTIDKIINISQTLPHGIDGINKIYYHIFDIIITDFSDTMEISEDYINHIETIMHQRVNNEHFKIITTIKANIYNIKKQVRPLLYIGDQFVVNENKIIKPEYIHFFNNIDIRINKLYDFAVNLQEYANQTLYSYDSKITIQTNEIVSKLTILTIFFGPLTVITGIYGMNFEHMPEIKWIFGYPLALLFMASVSLSIFLFLKHKKWL